MRVSFALFAFLLFVPAMAYSNQLSATRSSSDLLETDTTMVLSERVDPDEGLQFPPSMGLQVLGTEVMTQLTGAGSLNATDTRWNVHGTDLGHMFLHKDELYMVFGDTYGPDGGDWRSNTIARIADPNPLNGLPFASMIEGAAGFAKEVVRSAKVPGFEWTVIPTNGISLGDRMVLHYMSVLMWGADDKWYVRSSGLAYSDDDGQTWTRSDTAIWPPRTGFEQVAYVESEGMIYAFGIPQGRFGDVRLGRVATEDMLDPTAYTYWNGQNWSAKIGDAAPVVPAPAGELSVAWSAAHQSWLMMYLDPREKAIVLRSAPDLTGRWSDAQTVAHADDYPGLYAPYIVPGLEIDQDFYFTMSRWKPLYNVFLMKGRLAPAISGMVAADMITPAELPGQ